MKKWLKAILSCLLCVITSFGVLTGCGGEKDDGMRTVTFELCTELKTNPVLPKEVVKGDVVTKPVVAVSGENPNNEEVEGWYRDREYTQPWSFYTDTVEEDITLYAKWVKKFDVYYFLGEETDTYMFKEQFREGSIITPNESLKHGYRSDGFFADPEHTTPFDFSQPITGHKNIYIHRSDEFYFSAEMIATRFVPQAAPSGAGSKAGTIELAGEGEDQYADINFGYSTAADPHILLQNVTVDISHSKKIKLTMKNLGKAKTIKFFFTAWIDNDTKEYAGESYFTETCAYSYQYKATEVGLTEESPWQEVEIDIANGMLGKSDSKGISAWGESKTLLKLRIDSPYVCTDENDLSNRLLIKSIEGVKDPNYKPLDDSAALKAQFADDNAAEVKAVADAQQAITGFIFPKDNAYAEPVVVEGGKNISLYNKKEGLLMHAPIRGKEMKMVFNAGDKVINMHDYTTLVLRFRNYGYVKNLKVTWEHRYTEYYDANEVGRKGSETFAIPSRTDGIVECEFNMSGANQWKEFFNSLTIEYTSEGIDNAILFESIEFKPYKVTEIPGFNFDDRNIFGLTSTEALDVTYSAPDYATKFKVIDDTQAVVNIDCMANTTYTCAGYELVSLSYKQKSEGITKVNVFLTVDGQEQLYSFDVTVTDKLETISLPIPLGGRVTNFRMTFEGTGEICIGSIRFKANNAIAWDFGTSAAFDKIKTGPKEWSELASYDNNLSAVALAPCDHASPLKYYYGAMKAWKLSSVGNISLADKSKLVIVYYNPGTVEALAFSLGWTEMEDYEENGQMMPWDEKITQPGGTGGSCNLTLQTNMKEGEWAYAEIDLSKFGGLKDDERVNKAITTLFVNHLNGYKEKDTVYIRLINII